MRQIDDYWYYKNAYKGAPMRDFIDKILQFYYERGYSVTELYIPQEWKNELFEEINFCNNIKYDCEYVRIFDSESNDFRIVSVKKEPQ